MSCSSRWPSDRARRALLLGACLAGALPALPATAQAGHPLLPGGRLQGEGTLRFFGLAVYQARLWTLPDFRAADFASHPLLLELAYQRELSGDAIARRSLQEMRRAATLDEAQAERWLAAMQAAFPDVKAGDRIAGLHRPGEGARFWHNDRPLGVIADPAFSRLFFGIWLAGSTSEPALRQALLGAAGAPR